MPSFTIENDVEVIITQHALDQFRARVYGGAGPADVHKVFSEATRVTVKTVAWYTAAVLKKTEFGTHYYFNEEVGVVFVVDVKELGRWRATTCWVLRKETTPTPFIRMSVKEYSQLKYKLKIDLKNAISDMVEISRTDPKRALLVAKVREIEKQLAELKLRI